MNTLIDHFSTWADLVPWFPMSSRPSISSLTSFTNGLRLSDSAVRGSKTGHFVEAKRAFSQIGLLTSPGQADLTVLEAIRPHLAGLAATQKCGKRTDHSTKRSQASGWHAKTANVQFVLCFTGKTGLNPQKPKQNQGSRQGGPRPQLGSPAPPACTSSPLLQALPARPPIQGRPGGSTWPSRRLNMAQHDPKIASPRDQLGFKFDFTDHSDFMD